LFVLEVFRDDIDFLLRLGWDRRWNSFDTSWDRFYIFLGEPLRCQMDLRSKFGCNFSPEGVRFVIGEKCILVRFVYK